MRDLPAAYLAEAPDLMPFYGRPPKALFSHRPEPPSWDKALIEALDAYQARVGCAGRVSGKETVVISGQQPGLFTGPLYTIYKAVTAIRLAEDVQSRLGVPCVPVFWVGSDDHDFEEAGVAHFLTKSHELLSLRYTPSQDVDGMPLYRVPVEESLHGLIDRVAAQTPGSEFRSEVAGVLHDTLGESESLADWTTRLLARLFTETRLVVMCPQLPAGRALAATVLEQEIAEPLASTRVLQDTGARLKALGYPEQVTRKETECNFFLEVDGRRRKVLFEGGRYVVAGEKARYSVDEMLGLLREAPESFSPNVVLRCIVQQRLFPAVACVAGPGELAYWAQLKPLFEHFRLPMPVVYPRVSCTLTSAKLSKLLARLGFVIDDLMGPTEKLVALAFRAVADDATVRVVRDHRENIGAALQGLQGALGPHDKTAGRMAARIQQRVMADLDRLEQTIVRADETQAEATRKQVMRLCAALAPRRKAQERVYTIFSFVFEHGWSLVPRLVRELDITSSSMREVEL